MKKSIKSLGELLHKEQQKSIHGGSSPSSCLTDQDCLLPGQDPFCIAPFCIQIIPTEPGFCTYVNKCN
jgi:hypothetical protein